MSGALANLYMMEIDKSIHDFVTAYNGLYMRYSDDFIIVLPRIGETVAFGALMEISSLFNSPNCPGLELQQSKTQYYHFHEIFAEKYYHLFFKSRSDTARLRKIRH